MKRQYVYFTICVLLLTQCSPKKEESHQVTRATQTISNGEGKIVVLGVNHNKETGCFFDEASKATIALLFDSILSLSEGRKIVVVSEGSDLNQRGYVVDRCFPEVFRNLYFIGVETRSRAEKKEFIRLTEVVPTALYRRIRVNRFDFFKSIDFHSESVKVKATLDLRGIPKDTLLLAHRFKEMNNMFESTMISTALEEKSKGNFVIVCCGGMHAVSLNQSHGFDFILTNSATKDENLKMFLALKAFQALMDIKDGRNNEKTTN